MKSLELLKIVKDYKYYFFIIFGSYYINKLGDIFFYFYLKIKIMENFKLKYFILNFNLI